MDKRLETIRKLQEGELKIVQAKLYDMQQVGIANLDKDELEIFQSLHNRQKSLMNELYTITKMRAN